MDVTVMCLTCKCINEDNVFNVCTGGFLHQIQSCTSNSGYWIHFLPQAEPYFVRKLRDFNTFCCKYHQEMIEIKVGFNNMRTQAVHQQGLNSPCACSCESICGNPINGAGQGQGVSCQVGYHTYKSCSDLWEMFYVPKSRDMNGLV